VRLSACSLVPALLLFSAGALAQFVEEVGGSFAVRVGISHTDNLGRVRGDAEPESSTFGTAGLFLAAAHDRGRLQGNADGALVYYHYDHERFRNEVAGSLNAGLNVRIVPQTFSWDFRNRWGTVRRNPFLTTGPGNREWLNVFSTGPDVLFSLSARTSLGMNARYLDRRWQDRDDLNNNRRTADVSLWRELGSSRRLGLTLGTSRTEYDAPMVEGYEMDTALLSYQRMLPTRSMSLGIGTHRLEYIDASRRRTFITGSFNQALTPRSSMSVNASRRFEDSADQLEDELEFRDDSQGLRDVPISASPLMRSQIGVRYSLTRTRAVFFVGSSWSSVEYETGDRADRESIVGTGGVAYRFTPAMQGRLDAFYGRERTDLANELEDFTDRGNYGGISASLIRLLSRTTSLSFNYQRLERRGSANRDFSENRYLLSLAWSPLGR
jgi:hypothetical protein